MATVIGTGSNPGEVGVLGESQEAEGVRGVGHKGAGVSGTSEKWVGVYGKGGHLAGFFDGNVNIARDLIVNGKAVINGAVLDIAGLVQRIVLLEQEVARLKNQPLPPPPASLNYSITVSVTSSQLVLSGSDFQPNKDCYIHIVYPDLSRNVVTQSADSVGKLSYAASTSTWCLLPEMALKFTVNQPDSAGRDKWSNIATTSCP